jgi:hypothetical protein
MEPINFYGNAGEDFDTWWILVQVYIEDQAEMFPKDERTINWIGLLMKSYAVSWHIQWIKGTLSGAHPKSMTGYVNALKLRIEDKDAKDEAYADMEMVRYEGCIRDMFPKIETFNHKAMDTGAALKKMILERLPQNVLGKSDQEIISIITSAGRPAEKLEAARKNLGPKTSLRTYEKKHYNLGRFKDKPETIEQQRFRMDCSERKWFKNDRSGKKHR